MTETFQERGTIRAQGLRALRRLRRLVKAAGGPDEVARMIGSTRSHVANVVWAIRPLGKDTASRLRTVLPISDRVVLDLMALERSDLKWIRSHHADSDEARA